MSHKKQVDLIRSKQKSTEEILSNLENFYRKKKHELRLDHSKENLETAMEEDSEHADQFRNDNLYLDGTFTKIPKSPRRFSAMSVTTLCTTPAKSSRSKQNQREPLSQSQMIMSIQPESIVEDFETDRQFNRGLKKLAQFKKGQVLDVRFRKTAQILSAIAAQQVQEDAHRSGEGLKQVVSRKKIQKSASSFSSSRTPQRILNIREQNKPNLVKNEIFSDRTSASMQSFINYKSPLGPSTSELKRQSSRVIDQIESSRSERTEALGQRTSNANTTREQQEIKRKQQANFQRKKVLKMIYTDRRGQENKYDIEQKDVKNLLNLVEIAPQEKTESKRRQEETISKQRKKGLEIR